MKSLKRVSPDVLRKARPRLNMVAMALHRQGCWDKLMPDVVCITKYHVAGPQWEGKDFLQLL